MALQLKSRSQFVARVARELKLNHGKHPGSFIFALSGKWGEGKTTLLDELKKFLNNENKEYQENYLVIDAIQPWKFGKDKVSLMRSLVLSLDKHTGKLKWWDRVNNWVNGVKADRNDFLFADTTRVFLHTGWLIVALLVGLTLLLLAFLVPNPTAWLVVVELLLGVLFVPIFLKLGTVSQNKAAINATIDFDKAMDERLGKLEHKKIVFFIDDLDRTDPSTARFFLDNLRTFFDRPQVSYVITGDHTVLEGNLGRELLPKARLPDQAEEGRRFLKKIFNLSWKLPLPLADDIDQYVEELFKRQQERVQKFLNPTDQNTLKLWLKKYFSKNFRAIERFFQLAMFNLDVANVDEVENKVAAKFAVSVKNNPLLLIRILMIQDLANPFFQKIERNPKLFSDIEKAAAMGDADKMDGLLSPYRDDYSNEHINFMREFMQEIPRFYVGTNLQVLSMEPFIYLAIDPNLNDESGATDADFQTHLINGGSQGITETFVLSNPTRCRSLLELSVTVINNEKDLPKKIEYIQTLLGAIYNLDVESDVHALFMDTVITGVDWIALFTATPREAKMAFYQTLWQWMDRQLKEYDPRLDPVFVLENDNDHVRLISITKIGKPTLTVLIQWFVRAYKANKAFAINVLAPKLITFDVHFAENFTDEFLNTVINDAATQEPYRNETALILIKHTNGRAIEPFKSALYARAVDEMKRQSDSVWGWVIRELIPQYGSVINVTDLENAIIAGIGSINDPQDLKRSLIWLVGKNQVHPTPVWNTVISSHIAAFIELWFTDTDMIRPRFRPLKPDEGQQSQLFEAAIEYVKLAPTEKRRHHLARLEPTMWLWEGMKDPDLSVIAEMLNDHELRANARALLTHWGK